MTPQKLFDECVALPVEAQRQVADFIAFLQQRYVANQITQKTCQTELKKQPFIEMWHNRQDLSSCKFSCDWNGDAGRLNQHHLTRSMGWMESTP